MANSSTETSNIVTIKEYLNGCAGNYPIEEDTFKYLAVKCNVTLDQDVSQLSTAERNVCEMAMLRYILRAPGMTQSVQDANGTWSHKEGAVEMNSADKKFLLARLRELEEALHVKNSTIKMHNYGLGIWHQK